MIWSRRTTLALPLALALAAAAEPTEGTTERPRAAASAAAEPAVPTLDVSAVDQEPEAVASPPPEYPFELQRDGISGFALVDFVVDSRGGVRFAHTLVCSHPAFGFSAVTAVKQWQFKPGIRSSRPVNTHLEMPLTFASAQRAIRQEDLVGVTEWGSDLYRRWAQAHHVNTSWAMSTLASQHSNSTLLITQARDGRLSARPAYGPEGSTPAQMVLIAYVTHILDQATVSPALAAYFRQSPEVYLTFPLF